MEKIVTIWNVFSQRRKRFFVSLTLMLAAVLLLDFALRVYVPRDDGLRVFQQPSIQSIPSRDQAVAIEQRLNAALPARVDADSLRVVPRELALQGVFSLSLKRFAVVALAPQGDRPLERRTLRVGDEVEGWAVEDIGRSTVSLRQGVNSRTLAIFPGKPQ